MDEPLLSVNNLSVAFRQDVVVDQVSFTINRSETFALVGESGSGKSITALAVMRLLPNGARLSASSVVLSDENLLSIPEIDFCRLRGKRIALIFQDPMSSLNPVMTIGEQIAEVMRIHFNYRKKEIKARVLQLLEQVEIPDPKRRVNEYPHQLSGGQRQRVMIAIALAGQPDLLIADEPTTALDVTIQQQILELLKNIQRKNGMALWLISHDLALVANMADRIAVMQSGRIVETAATSDFFEHARHPYSVKLLEALPDMDSCLGRKGAEGSSLLEVTDFKVYYPVRKGVFKRVVDHVRAVDGVSFSLQKGKTLALVGESGCGKTTLGKALLNLIQPCAGQVMFDGNDMAKLKGENLRRQRAAMQIIFQDPFASMNPRMLVGDIIAEGIRALQPHIGSAERQERVAKLLSQVELPENSAQRYPHEFSGGQRQRICIARALAVEPELLVCDEPTSALDVSVQAQIIELLKTVQKEQGLSYLFITHDLAVVAEIADEVAVMYHGKIVEHGGVEQVLTRPVHAYTKKLLNAVPRLVRSEL